MLIFNKLKATNNILCRNKFLYIIDIKGFTIQITSFLYDCRYDKIPLPLGHHQPAIFFALN